MAISDLKYTKYASILIFKYEPILSDLNTDHKHQLNIGMAQGSEQRVPSTHAIVEISLSVLSIASHCLFAILC